MTYYIHEGECLFTNAKNIYFEKSLQMPNAPLIFL